MADLLIIGLFCLGVVALVVTTFALDVVSDWFKRSRKGGRHAK